jgi:hypothetical protein
MTRTKRPRMSRRRSASLGYTLAVADRGFRASFERIDGATGAAGHGSERWARTTPSLGTLLKAWSEFGDMIWRDETRSGRAGQVFKLDESGVTDGTTANSFAVSYRVPRQVDQTA